MDFSRRAGILLHPTSLPGPGGIGVLGGEAAEFVDFLAGAGCTVWQMLPLGPTGYGNSPYSSYSAFAGNPLLIDLRQLVAEGWLTAEEAYCPDGGERIDYSMVRAHKFPLLSLAADRFLAGTTPDGKREFWQFCDATPWLHDYALFMALKDKYEGGCWVSWPKDISLRDPVAIEGASRELGVAIGRQKFIQWQFQRQWQALHRYAGERGVLVFGDMPIYVAYDSADVWANRHLFMLDDDGRQTVVAGVPPDYFSKTGQLWGNPLYQWEHHKTDGFSWWRERLRNALQQCDLLRIDHFRGFESCWQVPAGELTAENGSWLMTPGRELFGAVTNDLGALPLVAEDLGLITPEVESLRDELAFPGMKVLQFAFGSDATNPYLPHNHCHRSVVYTGTHDNDTTLGWFASLGKNRQERVLEYLSASSNDMPWPIIRAAFASTAFMAIAPMQDILSLGSNGRMNRPGVADGNWDWRLDSAAITTAISLKLQGILEMYGRTVKNKK